MLGADPPYPPVTLALELIYDAVRARFAAEGPFNVDQPFGWRFAAQPRLRDRIIWIPGAPMGAVGRVGPPRNPGGEPRSLGTLTEFFHVIINAQDPREPENERLQYRLTRQLRDYWFRAVYLRAHGVFRIEAEEWNTTKLERRYGTALIVTASVDAAVLDEAPDGSGSDNAVDAPADTGAVVDVSELDVTETVTVEGAAPGDAKEGES